MVLSGLVMDNSLCMLMDFVREIKSKHRSFTACNLLWFWIKEPLDGVIVTTPIGHVFGLPHPCTQRYRLAPVLCV